MVGVTWEVMRRDAAPPGTVTQKSAQSAHNRGMFKICLLAAVALTVAAPLAMFIAVKFAVPLLIVAVAAGAFYGTRLALRIRRALHGRNLADAPREAVERA